MNLYHKNQTKHILFRLVEQSDAEFILSLRTNPKKNKYLSTVNQSLADQQAWIKSYKQREYQKEEFYYVISDHENNDLGLVRIYDIQGNSFSWGSWIIIDGAPPYVAIESALLVYEIGFYKLGFTESHFEVLRENKSVLKFHLRFGAQVTGESKEKIFLSIGIDAYEEARKKYTRYLTSQNTRSSHNEPLVQLTELIDPRGRLTVGEENKDIPFTPKRFFFIDQVPSGKLRGEHAHKECHQFLIAVRGSINVILNDGLESKEYLLNSPNIGLYIKPGIWGVQYNYSSDAMLLVLASTPYEPSDYIRNYDEFLKWKRENP